MDAQQRKALINENRAKALERIRERQQNIKTGLKQVDGSASKQDSLKRPITNDSTNSTTNVDIAKHPKLTLTQEQRHLIEQNRLKALERLRQKQGVSNGNLRDASDSSVRQYQPAIPGSINKSNGAGVTANNDNKEKLTTFIKPSVRKSDYIEYDFSTMKDTYGGFVSNKKLDKNGNPIEMTLTDWKNQQLEKKNSIFNDDDDDDLPPMDIHGAPTCSDCRSIALDKKMLEIFDCKVCKSCKEKYPEKYSLLTKTECKEDYFLTEPELADVALFKRLVKENPHSGTFSRMQLFLRCQIEEYAFKKWGSEESLDKEWLRREEMRKNRREKKFNNKLKEMRKKLRAEELTRNLRANRDKKHVHDWSLPVKRESSSEDTTTNNVFIKRCIDCGMEIEEILM